MKLLTQSDTELAALYGAIGTELRRRVSAGTCDDLTIVRGQEMEKRALTIALAGNHSILFVGPTASGKTMLRAAALKLGEIVTLEARPCPCGNLNSPAVHCSCKPAAIRRHQATIPVADITIETPTVPQRELMGRTPGTGSAETAAAIARMTARTDLSLCGDCSNLLKAACIELEIDASAREKIIRVARGIANIDQSAEIRPTHICEAINCWLF